MATSDSPECARTLSLYLSRWLVAITIGIALAAGFLITHFTVGSFYGDIREIKTRVQSIEQKVDENAARVRKNEAALREVEELGGIDIDAIEP